MAKTKKDTPEKEYKDTRKDITGETSIEHVQGENFATLYANEPWSYKLALKMVKEHPEKAIVKYHWPEEKCIQIQVPAQVIKYIKWPTKREISEETRQKLRENVAKARENKQKENT